MQTLPAVFVLALAACGAAGCTSPMEGDEVAALRAIPSSPPPELLLGPNDVLHVGVYGHPELSPSASGGPGGGRVDSAGNLSMPLAGSVHVGGLNLAQAREAVQTALAAYVKDARVDLSIAEFGARRFYLFGEVARPGAFPLDRPLTIYQALAQGGGFKPRAYREQIVLLRAGAEPQARFVHCETPDASGLDWIRPDDFLFVRRTGAGKFYEEVLPVLQGIGATTSILATAVLVDDQLSNN